MPFGLRVLPLVALFAAGGCFATRSDVRVIQTDIASMRLEMTRSDAQLRADLQATATMLREATDSLSRVSARTVSIQGDVRGESRAIREQLLQIQSLVGQSQSNISRMRAELELRNNAAPPYSMPADSSMTTGGAASGTAGGMMPSSQPGPNQLYTSGRDQLNRGSAATARMQFQDLLLKYPTSDLAPEAQYWIAESYAREKNTAAADVAYAAVVATYPNHRYAATALYKRALILEAQNNGAESRRLLQDVVSRYPGSAEAGLAADKLKSRQ